ncbi:MAG TPA: hypothetical protein VNJ02_16305 [Vicinamibacterales bacterium]|nr:hypothetical protein [Vicinamibacterales bacterium]
MYAQTIGERWPNQIAGFRRDNDRWADAVAKLAAESERRQKDRNLSNQGVRSADADGLRALIREVVDEQDSHLRTLKQRSAASLSEVVQRSAPRQADPTEAILDDQRQREFRDQLLDLDQLAVQSVYRAAMEGDSPDHAFIARAIENSPPRLVLALGAKVPAIAPFIDQNVRVEAARLRAKRLGTATATLDLLENLATLTKIWTIVYGGLVNDLGRLIPAGSTPNPGDGSDRIAQMAAGIA